MNPDTGSKVIRYTAGPAIDPDDPGSGDGWNEVDLSTLFFYSNIGGPTGILNEDGHVVFNGVGGTPEFSLPGFSLAPDTAYEFEFTYAEGNGAGSDRTAAYGITSVDQSTYESFGYDHEFFSWFDSDGTPVATYVIGPGRVQYEPAIAAGEIYPLFMVDNSMSVLTGIRWRVLAPVWQEFDLTDAVIYTSGGQPTGDIVDGTIAGYDAGGGSRNAPNFGFPGFVLTPGVSYEFEFTYAAPVAYGDAGTQMWGAVNPGQAGYAASNSSAHRLFFDYGGEVQGHAVQPGRYNYDAAMTAGAVHPVFESEADAVLTSLRWRNKADAGPSGPPPQPTKTTLTLHGPATPEQGDSEKHKGMYAVDRTTRKVSGVMKIGCDEMQVWVRPVVRFFRVEGEVVVGYGSTVFPSAQIPQIAHWNKVQIRGDVPLGASHYLIDVEMFSDASLSTRLPEDTEVYYDSIFVPEGGHDLTGVDYLDGDQPHGIWEGEERNSTSIIGQKPVTDLSRNVVLDDDFTILT